MREGSSLKDQLFNRKTLGVLENVLANALGAQFDREKFVTRLVLAFPALELKERIYAISQEIHAHVTEGFIPTSHKIEAALPPPLDPTKTDKDFGDFIFAPLGKWAVHAGLETNPARLLEFLAALTQRFSMEDAIRPVLDRWPEDVFAKMVQWATHPNYHVRRLVSEGTRPRLPWSSRLKTDPLTPLPLLDILHNDPTRYVTRSVANHLNDLTKMHPDLVIERLETWHKAGRASTSELNWVTRHALRGLIKAGHPRALALIGIDVSAPISVTKFVLHSAQITMGQALEFDVTLCPDRAANAVIDYVIWFQKASRKLSPKVFKLRSLNLPAGQNITIKKRHLFKDNATTFRLYPGAHKIGITVNGKLLCESPFTLKEKQP